MKKLILTTFALMIGSYSTSWAQTELSNHNKDITAVFKDVGSIESLYFGNISSDAAEVKFRNDTLSGPSLVLNGEKLVMKIDESDRGFVGTGRGLDYRISYSLDNDKLGIEVTLTNTLKTSLDNAQLSLRLGLSTEMRKYPQWREEFFPTLLRCEKTHFWGYLMTPNGRVLTITSPNPIASYHLHYNNSKIFAHGHIIRTVSLDLLNPGPLPERHPEGSSILPGQTKKWTIYIEEAKNLESIKSIAIKNTQAPFIEADIYTVKKGRDCELSVSSISKPTITVKRPDNNSQSIKISRNDAGAYKFTYRPESIGVYTIYARDSKTGKISEAHISCIDDLYSDYIKSARRAAIKYPQQAASHTESWYGFFSGYIAKQYFPDKEWDKLLDEKFNELYPLMYDSVTNIPVYYMRRIQNHAMMAALFAQRYKATGSEEELVKAAELADYIMSMQTPDGAYRSGNTHYTSVIYIAKALMEVMEQEKKLAAESAEWAHRYKRHYHSVKSAIDELTKNLDNIQTEGEMTFEDGMISCSYTQISQFALLQPEGSADRARYIAAAEKMAQLHRCLSQIIIPDSRMNGGSMRYWEAQYDILSSPNMMNSPHGWTAWRIYGLKNLYELTGKQEYLNQMMNAIGTCIQLLDPKSDKLNWAFIVDPYIVADIYVQDPSNPSKGKYQKEVIGEQYMPMISDWYKPKPNTLVTGYWGYDGGNCDNDVHEIFKCLAEILLTNAYIYEKSDGSIVGYNCSITKEREGISVNPDESVVTNLHYNLKKSTEITFRGEVKTTPSNHFGWL